VFAFRQKTKTVAATETNTKRTREAVSKYFEEVKEFTVGKRMPDKGGVQAWIKDVGEEPMPIRFELESICKHPAMASKEKDCFEYSETYCSEHLQRMDESVSCTPSLEPECLFDLDCPLDHHVCNEGTCTPEPDCFVETFKDEGLPLAPFGPIQLALPLVVEGSRARA